MPNLAKKPPISPVSAVSAVSAIPATAVGKANGSSIIPSIKRLSGNVYFTSTHASTTPITALISDATNAVTKLTLKLDKTLSRVIVSMISLKLICAENTTSDASGISTTTLKIVSVMPVVRPKPGMTLLFVLFIIEAKYRTRHSLCPILNKYHVL